MFMRERHTDVEKKENYIYNDLFEYEVDLRRFRHLSETITLLTGYIELLKRCWDRQREGRGNKKTIIKKDEEKKYCVQNA